jgi:phosphate transport system substrate-binding protein
MNHIDDNFLYELRTQPPPGFASRLKAKLDRQANEADAKRRAFKWFVFGAILMGGTALALVSPSLRQATVARVMNFWGSSVPQGEGESQRQANTLAAGAREDRLAGQDRIYTKNDMDPGNTVARTESAASSEAMASANARTIVLPPASSERAAISVNQQLRSTVRIGHSAELASLAEGIVIELESRLSGVSVVTSEVPENTELCSWQFKRSNIDIVLTEQRVSGAGSQACAGGTRYEEIPFAYDAIVVIVNRENTWASSISPTDLRKLSEELPSGPLTTPSADAVTTWSQIRSQWPTLPFTLFGTSMQRSGLGLRFAQLIEMDRNPTALAVTKDDRATLSSVESSLGAMGYIDFSTLVTAKSDRYAWPTVAAITNAKGEAVEPTIAAIQEGRYPLSRTIWLYVNTNEWRRIQMQEVVRGLLGSQPPKAVADHGFIPVERSEREERLRRMFESIKWSRN